jgi:hypothetical protein
MKKINNLMRLGVITLFSLFLFSCERYEEPSYPNIDGEYVIDHVQVLIEDQITGIRKDTMWYTDTFSLYMPITPLDSFIVGTTRFKITNNGRTFMWNKDQTVFGNPWTSQAPSYIHQDILSREWDILQIHFMYSSSVTRVFELTMVGMDDFSAWIRQYPFKAEGPKYQIRYHFHKVGP